MTTSTFNKKHNHKPKNTFKHHFSPNLMLAEINNCSGFLVDSFVPRHAKGSKVNV